jgi:hypothetical protein
MDGHSCALACRRLCITRNCIKCKMKHFPSTGVQSRGLEAQAKWAAGKAAARSEHADWLPYQGVFQMPWGCRSTSKPRNVFQPQRTRVLGPTHPGLSAQTVSWAQHTHTRALGTNRVLGPTHPPGITAQTVSWAQHTHTRPLGTNRVLGRCPRRRAHRGEDLPNAHSERRACAGRPRRGLNSAIDPLEARPQNQSNQLQPPRQQSTRDSRESIPGSSAIAASRPPRRPGPPKHHRALRDDPSLRPSDRARPGARRGLIRHPGAIGRLDGSRSRPDHLKLRPPKGRRTN